MRSLLRFYLTTCAVSWLIWLPYWVFWILPNWRTSPIPHYVGLAGPLIAGLLWTGYERGTIGLRSLLRSMFVPRGRVVYWLVVPLVPLLSVVVIAWLVSTYRSESIDWSSLWHTRELPTVAPVTYLLLTLGWVGLGEETGWRGYALPRLQQHFSALTASALLTVGWAIWHWPLFYYTGSGYSAMVMGDVVGWLFSLLLGSVLFTWLFNQSRGSILACAFFHGMMDVAFMADLRMPGVQPFVGGAVAVAGLYIMLVYGPKTLSRRGKVEAL